MNDLTEHQITARAIGKFLGLAVRIVWEVLIMITIYKVLIAG